MSIKIALPFILSSLFVGCVSMPTADPKVSEQVKQFEAPASGNASVYIYRSDSIVGGLQKKDVWVDGECLGETIRGAFFHKEVEGNKEHVFSTESEFSPNHLKLNTETGKTYFIKQYIKPGVFVGGANLKVVDDAEGKKAISESRLTPNGKCSKPSINLEK